MRRNLLLALPLLACTTTADPADTATTTATTSTSPPTPSTTGPTTTSDDSGTSERPPITYPSTSDPDPSLPDPSATSTSSTSTETGDPAVACADLPLCDDFESAAVGGPPDAGLWTIASPSCAGAGTLAVADDQAHSGSRSLRVDGGGGYCDHVFIAHTAAIASLGAVVHGRVWVRFTDALGGGHTTFMTLHDAADGDKDLRMGGQSQIFMWNRESDDATLPALSPTGIGLSTAPSAGAWTCVEFTIDGDQGLLGTSVDGVEIAGLQVDAAPTPDVDQQWLSKPMWRPDITDFKLGWESYAGQTMVVHFDDVALADHPIGCN